MPIDPALYPPDWPAISLRIRARSGGRCECDGRCARHEDRCTAFHGGRHPVTGSKVVLTVAHLDHALVDHSDANLAAMCQRCHLAYDAAARRAARPMCHLVRVPGDKHTVCGRKTALSPTCWVPFAKAHAEGHGQVFCSICVAGLGPLAPKVPTAPPD